MHYLFEQLILSITLVSSLFHVLQSLQLQNENDCPTPYNTCNTPAPGMLNVHMVPHTHNDVGWLKTVDQYYYGSNNKAADHIGGVQYILDTVIQELNKDPNRRFVYVEIAYFYRWWKQQNNSTKDIVRNLVNQNRLEFVIGGWCMNDEATTYYNDMIDQQTLGFKFILKEFGKCARPRVAWQLDPFGHSREQGSLFAQFGFDAVLQGRIDYQDDAYKTQTKTREQVWQASRNLGSNAEIFNSVLIHLYIEPVGFCFDVKCDDDPIMDDPELEDYNVDEKVNTFIEYVNELSTHYKTNNLLVTMGSDFHWTDAKQYFKNIDKLIKYVNQRQDNGSKVNLFYSTPGCYIYSVHQTNQTWTVKTDDFFPYAHRAYSFWTGYYTSRATLKDNVRRTNNYLQAVRQLSALAKLNSTNVQSSLGLLTRAMGVLQHHDAVSGTERQHVARDYAKRLSIGTESCKSFLGDAYIKIVYGNKVDTSSINLDLQLCPLLNISECLPIENKKNFTVILYNPLAREVETWIRLPVVGDEYSVVEGSTGNSVRIDTFNIYNETKRIPERKTIADHEIIFKVKIGPLSFSVYNVTKINKLSQEKVKQIKDENVTLSNQYLQVQFVNGNLKQIITNDPSGNSLKTNISQNLCYYDSQVGIDVLPEFQSSGAYIFRPKHQEPECFQVSSFSVSFGTQVQEIHQIFNEWLSQTIRLYVDSQYLEFEWQVGPIPVSLFTGKEVITRFTSDIASKKTFYTDSNGREILTRIRDFRPGWPHFNQTEPVSGNYYPINSRIFIRDETNDMNQIPRQLTILTDRSQGGSSIVDGSVELMLHRRIISDDALGVDEPLDELGVDLNGLRVKGKHYLFLNNTAYSAKLHRDLAHKINMQPIATFYTQENSNNFDFDLFARLDGLKSIKQSLPDNLELLTLMQDFDSSNSQNNTLIVRFEHFYELNEDMALSNPVNIDIISLFNGTFSINDISELSLGANMDVNELNDRLKWNSSNKEHKLVVDDHVVKDDNNNKLKSYVITLNPMQIRTFQITFNV